MALIDDRASTRLIFSAAALVACAAPAQAQIAMPSNSPTVNAPVTGPRASDYSRASGFVPGPPDLGGAIFGPQFSFPIPALQRGQPALPESGGLPGEAAPETEAQAPAPSPAFFVVPRGAVEITATDNVNVTNTNPKSDLIVSPTAGLFAQIQTAHTSARLDGTVSYDAFANTHSFDATRYNGIGDIRTNLLGRAFEVAGRIATSQEQISVLGPTPATTRSFGLNQTQVINYGVTPTFRWRMGDAATGEASYDFSGIKYANAKAGTSISPFLLRDYVQHSGQVHVAAGPSFDRLTWELNGSISEEDHSSYLTQTRSGSGSLLYALWRNFRIVGTAGYDEIDDPTLRGVSGLYATGGIRWALSPRTNIDLEAGERYRMPYYAANITWQSRRLLVLHARYTQGVDTPQSVLTSNLRDILVDPRTSLPALTPGAIDNPNGNPLGLSALSFRRESFELGADMTFGRNSLRLLGAYERRRTDAQTDDSYRGSVTFSRQIAPNLRAYVAGGIDGYNTIKGLFAKTIQARAGADYLIGRRTALSISYTHRRAEALPVDTRENVAMLTLTRAF